ncbi:hypothetical protein EIP91_001654 [Steccherinum ochraceum]|uniref:Cytosolic endo-beta-N-acetylglucosaminidase TIM barrel domain-containing protein n=1 Tax=Steccherinum ochraceum TaxID=92696 RepID=A0A4V2MWG9_9APHY|nr:hypothetical protein EIP91_001654 [Steccherinum ochraceum]
MPLNGTNHSKLVLDDAPFFKTLAEFDEWADRMPQELSGVLPYRARRQSSPGSSSQGKLLLCHDYKGGYTESPSARSYTFNFWSFSHHRVTIPPSGWTTASHRQGVKMLGTILKFCVPMIVNISIFEGQDAEDCLRLLVGRLPQSKTGPLQTPAQRTIPVSSHYAKRLAQLARQRGFDGYLLNFECPLQGNIEQTRALSTWIALLEYELKREVGPHSEVIWYDSVIVDGRLRWQDRLNSVNLPFFLPSTGFFTNYTWPREFPSLTAQYFLSIDSQHLARSPPKTLQDIYVGVDVWGRGSHGGGGFGAYKAMDHIDPKFLGLSVALFGQAWSWETEQDKEGFTWETWWAHERKLWLGPVGPNDIVQIPEPPPGQPVCEHGPYTPVTSFFTRKPPPDPLDLTFYTSFSPGVGTAWFVEGAKVMDATASGWTDLHKTTSIGDLAWPHPAISSELGDWEETPPSVSPGICMYDAWMGGSSLRLDVTLPPSDDDSFHLIWIPIQSLSVTSQQSYDVNLVYKVPPHGPAEVDMGLSVKLFDDCDEEVEDVDVTSLPVEDRPSIGGWTHLAVRICVKSDTPRQTVAVGLIAGIAQEESSSNAKPLSLYLGQLTAFPSPPSDLSAISVPQLLWADYQMHDGAGVLTWDVAQSLPPIHGLSLTSLEDPQPAWVIDTNNRNFLYFNIYVQDGEASSESARASWFVGTSGLDGRGQRFFVDPACLPAQVGTSKKLRFTIEGVTDRGERLSRDRCVFVDVEHPT